MGPIPVVDGVTLGPVRLGGVLGQIGGVDGDRLGKGELKRRLAGVVVSGPASIDASVDCLTPAVGRVVAVIVGFLDLGRLKGDVHLAGGFHLRWHAHNIHLNNSVVGIGSDSAQVEDNVVFHVEVFDVLVGSHDLDSSNLILDFWDQQVGVGNFAQVQIDFSLFGGCLHAGWELGEAASSGVVHAVAVFREPRPGLAENVLALLRYPALLVWADVEQIVSALGGTVDEVCDDGVSVFPVVIKFVITPGAVEGHAALPVVVETGRRDLLLRRTVIAVIHMPLADAVVDDQVRVDGAQVAVELLAVLLGPPAGPLSIEEKYLHAIGFNQLAQLPLHAGDKIRFLRGVHISAPVALGFVMPVHDGVVSAKGDSLALALLRELHDRVFPLVVAVAHQAVILEIADFSVEHAEPLVMAGGKHDVFLSRILGEFDHLGRVELGRVEFLSNLRRVVLLGDLQVVHDPLRISGALPLVLAAEIGISAPVDELAVLGIPPPFHPCVKFLLGFGAVIGGEGEPVDVEISLLGKDEVDVVHPGDF